MSLPSPSTRRSSRLAALAGAAALALATVASPASAYVRTTDLACPQAAVPALPFSDVAVTSTHADAIACAVWWGVANGTSPSTYSPAGTVTRGQMASFLARTIQAAGEVLPTDVPDAFQDDDGTTHEHNIDLLADAGIVSGTSPSTYSPHAVVTRAQMASFLVRTYEWITYEELPAPSSGFVDTAGTTHALNIDKAAAAGFTGGTSPTAFTPSGLLRRDAIASFLTRALDALVEWGAVLPEAGAPPSGGEPDGGDGAPPPGDGGGDLGAAPPPPTGGDLPPELPPGF